MASRGSLSFTGADRKQIYGLVERTVQAHEYWRLVKKNKGAMRAKIRWFHHSLSERYWG